MYKRRGVCTADDVESGNVKYIPFSDPPEIQGLRPIRHKEDEMLRIVTQRDVVDMLFGTQVSAYLRGFDVYSDMVFVHALFTNAAYAAVAEWKRNAYVGLFCLSQVLWALLGLMLACHEESAMGCCGRLRLAVVDMFNGHLGSFMATMESLAQFRDRHGNPVAVVPVTSIAEWEAEGSIGMIPLTSTLIFEDLPMLTLNLIISQEVGWTFPSICAFCMSALCAVIKAVDMFRFWRACCRERSGSAKLHDAQYEMATYPEGDELEDKE